MFALRITKSFVDKVPLPEVKPGQSSAQAFYRDSDNKGFGLRVTSGGAKSFIVEKRIHGKVKRITLGSYGNLTVQQARKEAIRLLGEVATGKDPIAEKKARLIEQITLKETFEDYLKVRTSLRPSTLKDYRHTLDKAFSDWTEKPLVDITKDMVELRHRNLGKTSQARANNAMRVLRAIFNHAMVKYEDAQGQPVLVANPVNRISQLRAWFPVEPKQSLIKPHQLADWYQATLQLQQESTRDYLHLLLFTGLRRSEAATLTWKNVDLKDQTLTIPETKNHETHILPLSDFLYDLMQRRSDERASPYVFPSETERGHLIDPRTAVKRVGELSGVAFTLHDLRRTFITIADQLDIPAYALKRLLNHKDPRDMTARYIINSGVDRLREPMQRITNFIKENINPVGEG
jgi:integrase